MIGYLYLGMAIFATSIGQLLLKKHNMQDNKVSNYLLLALFLLVSVPILIYLSLIYISFTIVFLADAISIILVVVVSKVFLSETLNYKKVIGISLIIVGIFMLKGKVL
jgi:multidrug transporter EmrE-like cation transporter